MSAHTPTPWELNELEKDAARYRWLRRPQVSVDVPRVWTSALKGDSQVVCLELSDLNAAVDAAMVLERMQKVES